MTPGDARVLDGTPHSRVHPDQETLSGGPVGSQTLTDGPLEPLLRAIFDGFDAASIRYLVLRNYDGLPAVRRPGGDVDLLICPNHIDRAADLVRDIAASQ